ncbi:MAG: hypothetical protein ACYC3I_05955 [Gemmataceae bacterium]
MNGGEIVMEGTVKPDGTLELDDKPNLSPGRVQVVLRPAREADLTREGWRPYMQRIRSEREAAGCHFLSEAEMEAHIQWLREDEDRIDRIFREMDELRRQQEKR